MKKISERKVLSIVLPRQVPIWQRSEVIAELSFT